jgi:hypothetical protein
MNTIRNIAGIKTDLFESQRPLSNIEGNVLRGTTQLRPNQTMEAERAKQEQAAKAAANTKNVDSGLTTVRNGFDRIFCPKSVGSFLHAFPQIVGGGFQTMGSLIDGFFHSGGDYLHCLVEGIPVLENIAQPFADLFNGVGSTVESLFYGVGSALDSVGGAIESLCDGDLGGFFGGLGDAATDAIGGVTDAVGSAVDAVGDAIGDLFSGW